MEKLKTIIVGCGDRAYVYANEGVKNLGLMEIVACVDPDEVRLKYMRDNFGVSEKFCFKNLSELLSLGNKRYRHLADMRYGVYDFFERGR